MKKIIIMLLLCLPGLAQTNLGPIATTTQDQKGFTVAPPLPAVGFCRSYFNLNTGSTTWIDHNGAVCGGGSSGTAVVTNPSASQNIVQPNATWLRFNRANNFTYVTPSYNWLTSTLTDPLFAGVPATATITCPQGVDATSGVYGVKITDLGTPSNTEATPVTGGTCTSALASGTIIFTPVNSHLSYTLGSASQGTQEAINDAGLNSNVYLTPTDGADSTGVVIDYPVSVRNTNTTLYGYGAVWLCNTRQTCLQTGNRANANLTQMVKVYGLKLVPRNVFTGCQIQNTELTSNVVTITTDGACSPQTGDWMIQKWTPGFVFDGMVQVASTPDSTHYTYARTAGNIASAPSFGQSNIENAAIDDSSFPTHFTDVILGNSLGVSPGTGRFNVGWAIRDDQSTVIEECQVLFNSIKSDTSWVGDSIYTNRLTSAVLSVHDCNIDPLNSGGKGANGINHQSGNTLTSHDNVIQNIGEFGVWSRTQFASSNPNGEIINNYIESSPGNNPNGMGNAAHILNGGYTTIFGGTTQGHLPTFLGTSGATTIKVYLVAHASAYGASLPFRIGTYTTGGTGSTTIKYYQTGSTAIEGTMSWDLLGVGTGSTAAPSGTSNVGIVSGLTTSSCANGICTYVFDTATPFASYTVAAPTYYFPIQRTACDFCLSPTLSGNNAANASAATQLKLDFLGSATAGVIDIAGNIQPNIIADRCSSTAVWNAMMAKCLTFSTGSGAEFIVASPANGGLAADLKGVTNYILPWVGNNASAYPHGDLITYADTNPGATLATPNGRPLADTDDSALGFDNATGQLPANVQLALRTNKMYSIYIGSLFDSSSWLERITPTLKAFKIPVQTTAVAFASLPTCVAGLAGSMRSVNDSSTILYGTTVTGGGANFVLALCNGTNWIAH